MGEYVKVRGKEAKLGTCENLYYCTFRAYKAALPWMEKLSGNANPSEYGKPEVFRFRFPFPDEDETAIGGHEDYDRGAIVALPRGSFEAEHGHLTHSAHMKGGGYNVNISLPCPMSVHPYPLPCSLVPNDQPWEIIQQKLMKGGELWTVIRCGYCHAAVRLDKAGASTLVEQIRLYHLVKSNGEPKTPQDDAAVAFWAEMSRRIMEGYK